MNNPAAQPFLNISPTKQTPLRSVRRTSRRRNSRRRNSRGRNSRGRNSRGRNSRGRNSRRRNTRRRNSRRRNTRRRSSRRNSRRRNTRRRNTRRRSSRRNKNQLGGDEVNIDVQFGSGFTKLHDVIIKLDKERQEISFSLPYKRKVRNITQLQDIKLPFSTVNTWGVAEHALHAWVIFNKTPELEKMLGKIPKDLQNWIVRIWPEDKVKITFWCQSEAKQDFFTEQFDKMAEDAIKSDDGTDPTEGGEENPLELTDCEGKEEKGHCEDPCIWDAVLEECRNPL